MTYSIDGMTDQTGTYKIPVPDDHENEICEMVLVSSPQMECATVVRHADRARVALTRNNGIVSDTRYANNLGFLKDAPMVGCSQLLKKYQEYDDWETIEFLFSCYVDGEWCLVCLDYFLSIVLGWLN